MDCRSSAPPPAMAGRKREENRVPMSGKVRETGFQCLEKSAKPGSNVWKTSREVREGREGGFLWTCRLLRAIMGVASCERNETWQRLWQSC